MKILDRYILKGYLAILLGVWVVLEAIYTLILFFEILDNVLENKAPLKAVAVYLIHYQPQVIRDVLPLAFFFATLTYLIIASKNFELVALRALGMRTERVLVPFLIVAVLASIALVPWNLYVVPLHLTEAALAEKVEINRNKEAAFTRYTDLWIKQQNVSCFIRFFDERRMLFRKAKCVWVENGHIEALATADTVVWREGTWQMVKPIFLKVLNDQVQEDRPKTLPLALSITPQGLLSEKKEPWEMTYHELRDYLRAMEEEGYKVPNLKMELYQRIALAFSPIALVLLVFPLSLRSPREGGWKRVAITAGVLVLYWGATSLLAFLGRTGLLPSMIAAPLPPVAAVIVAGVLLRGAG